MQKTAIVTAVQGDQSEILVMRSEACGSCSACSGCQTKPQIQKLTNTLQAEVGDTVIVEMPNHLFVRHIFLLYLMPLLFFVLGIIVVHFVQAQPANDLLSFGGGLLGLALYTIVIRFIDRRSGEALRMVRVLSPEAVKARMERINATEVRA